MQVNTGCWMPGPCSWPLSWEWWVLMRYLRETGPTVYTATPFAGAPEPEVKPFQPNFLWADLRKATFVGPFILSMQWEMCSALWRCLNSGRLLPPQATTRVFTRKASLALVVLRQIYVPCHREQSRTNRNLIFRICMVKLVNGSVSLWLHRQSGANYVDDGADVSAGL